MHWACQYSLFQIFSSGETSRTQDSSNCSIIKGADPPRLHYVNERDQRKHNDPKPDKNKPRKMPRGRKKRIQNLFNVHWDIFSKGLFSVNLFLKFFLLC